MVAYGVRAVVFQRARTLNGPYGESVSGGTGSGLSTATYIASFSGAMPMVVGFTYTSWGQIVCPNAPAESGTRNGAALGKKRRTMQYALQLGGAGHDLGGSLTVGTDPAFVKVDPALFRQAIDVNYTVQQQYYREIAGGKSSCAPPTSRADMQ
jgi:hypothetical protein